MKHLKFLKHFQRLHYLSGVVAIACGLWVLITSLAPNIAPALTDDSHPSQLHSRQAQLALSVTSTSSGDWYPSKYGSDDEIGAANILTPELVKKAVGLVTEGKVYALGLEINENTPGYPPRKMEHYVIQNIGTSYNNNDDIIFGSLNVGTQIDGLAHLGIDGVFYNGNKAEDFVRMEGLTKLGIENIPPIVTRGVMLDIAAYKGVDRLQGGEVITVADIEGAAKQQGANIQQGDVVLLHTGWLGLVNQDRERFIREEPGPGIEAAEYLAAKGVVAVGDDTSRLEADPHEKSGLFFPVHQILLAKNGIYILENINTSVLVEAGVHEFLFVLGHPRFSGATQTIINPVAIR